MKKTLIVLAFLLTAFSFGQLQPKVAQANFCGHMSDGGYEPCIPGVAPAGYALVGIGYGSDDHRCTMIIEEAKLGVNGLTDRRTLTKRCAAGNGDDNLYRPGITQSTMGGNQYAGGWWWSAKTSGGTGWNGGWNDSAPSGDNECDIKAYRKIENNALTGPVVMAGSCVSRNYGSGIKGADNYYRNSNIKATAYVHDIVDPSSCAEGAGYYQCGVPIVGFPDNIPSSHYVITGVHFGLGTDADVRYVQVYPPANSNGIWNGYLDAEPVRTNIPDVMQPGETVTKGNDGGQLYVTMKNLGMDWVSNDQKAIPNTSIGTCEEDTDGDGIKDAPLIDSTGASCSVTYEFSSNAIKLSHKDSAFTATPKDIIYVKDAKITRTISQKKFCTIVDPVGGGLYNPAWYNWLQKLINIAFARPIGTLECEFVNTLVTSVDKSSNIATNEEVTFHFDSFKAPASDGSFTEYWQMQNAGTIFGAPLIKNIQIGTSTDLYARLALGQLAYDVSDNNSRIDTIQNSGAQASDMTVLVSNKNNTDWLQIVSAPVGTDNILGGQTVNMSFKVKDGATPNDGDKAVISIVAMAASTTKGVYDNNQEVVVTYKKSVACNVGDPSCCNPATDSSCTSCLPTNPNCGGGGGGGNPTCTIKLNPSGVVTTTANSIQNFTVTLTPINGYSSSTNLAFSVDPGITIKNAPTSINPNQTIALQAFIGALQASTSNIIVTATCGTDSAGFPMSSSGSLMLQLDNASSGRIEIPPR